MSKQPPSTATQFDQFLAEEVRKVQGIWYPVKPTLLSRIFVRHAPLRKLHPNPEDEFCRPDIGPNHAIISQYERDFVEFGPNKYLSSSSSQVNASEPLEVQKIRPDGYMILNGHHRWAAASRVGIQRLRIHIINLTLKDDIERMLKTSRYDRRVTLDLDETVFCPFPGRSDGFEKRCPSHSAFSAVSASAWGSRRCSSSCPTRATTSGSIPPGIFPWIPCASCSAITAARSPAW